MRGGDRRGRDRHEHRGRRLGRGCLRLALVAALLACAAAGSVVAILHPFSGQRGGRTTPAPARPRPERPRHPVGPRRPKGPHDRPVPILMYHVIAAAPAGEPYPELFVPPRAFDGQLAWLARHGYHPVTLDRVYRYWRGLQPLPPRPVVLSFDDGYRADVVRALPAMRRRHWPGVLDLAVKNLGADGGLSRGQVQRLIAAGWELDAHSLTHPDLTRIGAQRLRREVAGSRRLLRRAFGVSVPFFCYPSGRFDRAVIAAVKKAGYLGATTTDPGPGRPGQLYTLRRIRVDGSESLASFAASLAAVSGGRA